MHVRASLLCLALVGCAGAPSAAFSAHEPTEEATSEAPVERDSPPERSPARHGFAETPMTPLAEAMADVVLAAIGAAELPSSGPIPFRPPSSYQRSGPPCEEPDEAAVAALCANPSGATVVFAQIDFGFHMRPYEEDRHNAIIGNLMVDGTGMTMGGVQPYSESRPRWRDGPPSWLTRMAPAAAAAIRTQLTSDSPRDLLTPLDRLPPLLAQGLERRREELSDWPTLIELASIAGDPLAYTHDDLVVYLTNAEGAWVGARVFYAEDDAGLSTAVRLRSLGD
jgi:hypothetical protein